MDHERLAGAPREPDLGFEGAFLVLARGVVAVVVEAGLADRDALLMAREGFELGVVSVIEPGRLTRVPPDRRVHLREVLGRCKRRPA